MFMFTFRIAFMISDEINYFDLMTLFSQIHSFVYSSSLIRLLILDLC